MSLPFPKRQMLDSSKLKEVADNKFKLDENGGKFSKLVVTSNFCFSHSVLNSHLQQTRKNQGLFGKRFRPFCLPVHVDISMKLSRMQNDERVFHASHL